MHKLWDRFAGEPQVRTKMLLGVFYLCQKKCFHEPVQKFNITYLCSCHLEKHFHYTLSVTVFALLFIFYLKPKLRVKDKEKFKTAQDSLLIWIVPRHSFSRISSISFHFRNYNIMLISWISIGRVNDIFFAFTFKEVKVKQKTYYWRKGILFTC